MSASVPRPASTVVLLRQETHGLTVFLVRRHAGAAFMAGAHVFPGGAVEGGDGDPAYAEISDGVIAATARLTDTGPTSALGICVAAVRETFEEAGVLLAMEASGETVALPRPELDPQALRRALVSGSTTLRDIVTRFRWRLTLDALAYFAHWVTPSIEPLRYDTRFFMAVAPAQQTAAHDHDETTEGIWVRPADAIALCRRGEMALPPPTWTTLRWLERFEDITAAMQWAHATTVPRIEPAVIQRPESRIVILPGDASMAAIDGFEATETRFVLSAGRWMPVADGQA